jgi:hypothetical protein
MNGVDGHQSLTSTSTTSYYIDLNGISRYQTSIFLDVVQCVLVIVLLYSTYSSM